jgi:site-specific recombinase XerD
MPSRLPVVLAREEVSDVLQRLRGGHALIGRLLYGTGLRIMEGVRLRVKTLTSHVAKFRRHALRRSTQRRAASSITSATSRFSAR